MTRRRTQSGVTLIELLIAVSLVSFISVGMLMAMRVGLSAMEKTNSKFLTNRKALSVQKIIQSQVAGLVPVTANCRPGGGPPVGRFLMFEGHPDQLRFVSTYSLAEAARGYPRLLEFRVITGENNRGVRLVVNERIYGGPFMVGSLCGAIAPAFDGGPPLPQFGPVEIGPASFVLADKLAYCRILYRRTLPPPAMEEWLPAWIVPDLLPSGIRIEMAPLDPDPAKLQIMTVSVPLRINKWVMGPYAD
jgi:prepilin-type N-terminal cleavage/methylation domain-containing protein